MDDDSLMKAYTCAVLGDLKDLQECLEEQPRESILVYLVHELREAGKRDDWTKISQILRAVSKDRVNWAYLTAMSSLRLSYWMGYRQGPPRLEWLNPYTRSPQTAGFLEKLKLPIELWPSM